MKWPCVNDVENISTSPCEAGWCSRWAGFAFAMSLILGLGTLSGDGANAAGSKEFRATEGDTIQIVYSLPSMLFLDNGVSWGFCPGCLAVLPERPDVDHIGAKARGGSDDAGNKQLLRPNCNRRRGAKPFTQFVAERLADGNEWTDYGL